MIDYIRILWQREPARFVSVLVAIVVFIAAKVGLVIDEQNVGEALLLILPVLLGGEATRAKVSPVPGPVGPANDDLLAPQPEPIDAIES